MTEAPRIQESELSHDGHRLFLREGGQGPECWLVHGFPTSSLDWLKLWPLLQDRFQLRAIDMLGFGRSDKPRDFAYSIMASADQWETLAASRNSREVLLIAHDYGDTVAQELLARQREGRLRFRISAVAMLNGGLFPESTHPLLIQMLLKGRLGPLVARLSSYGRFALSMRRICALPPSDAELHEHWRLLIQNGGRAVLPKIIRYIDERGYHRRRWREALQLTKVPLCHINGIRDPISGADTIERWRQLLPNSQSMELDGVGHYPQLEAPQSVSTALHDFFDTLKA